MNKTLLNLAALGLISGALVFTTTTNATEEKKPDKPAAEKAGDTKPEKKPRAIPFRGKVTAANKAAGTLTMGERVFHVTAETKISKRGRTATLAEAVNGENVTGSYLKGDDGKLNAVGIRLSPNSEGGESGSGIKKKQPQTEDSKEKRPKNS
jgi:hypothetical protein